MVNKIITVFTINHYRGIKQTRGDFTKNSVNEWKGGPRKIECGFMFKLWRSPWSAYFMKQTFSMQILKQSCFIGLYVISVQKVQVQVCEQEQIRCMETWLTRDVRMMKPNFEPASDLCSAGAWGRLSVSHRPADVCLPVKQ